MILSIPARRWNWCAAFTPRRISPRFTPSPRASRWSTAISPRSARTPGSSSRGTWRCNMCSPSAVKTDPLILFVKISHGGALVVLYKIKNIIFFNTITIPPPTPPPLTPPRPPPFAPPVMEARRWLTGVTFPPERPLINVSQAAPVDSPPLGLRQALADAALNNPDAHLYGPVLGLPALRAEIAAQWSAAYGGTITPTQTAITQGCNQAFTAVMSTLAGAGDEVILPTPWYFNHKMWLDMQGVACVPLMRRR